MNNLNAVKQMLGRNNYQVTAFVTDNGALVVYPERVEPPVCAVTRIQYDFVDEGSRVLIFDEEGNLHKDKVYECPHYAQKLLMFAHIIARCIHINFAITLITFVNGENEVSEEDFFEACKSKFYTEDDYRLENELKPIIIQGIFTVFTPMHEEAAKASGILEGFLAIRNLLIGQPVKKEEQNVPQKEDTVGGGS